MRASSQSAIDLMVQIPTGGSNRRPIHSLLRDEGSLQDSSPVEYLYKSYSTDVQSPEDILALFDKHNIRMAQLGIDAKNPDRIGKIIESYPERFFGCVSLDPNEGMGAVRALDRIVRNYAGVKSAFIVPCLLNPQVPLNDKKMFPIYAKCIELDIPINLTVGVPGPRVPMDCQNPYYLDEICWFFPELKVVMFHGGDPWTDLCVKLMLKWPNLYYATSAWSPKRYPKSIVDFANTRGTDKVMYAGYHPILPLDRIFAELGQVPLRDHVWGPFLHDNAVRVFGL